MGKDRHREALDMLRDLSHLTHQAKSPTKAIKISAASVETFLKKPGVVGQSLQRHSRHLAFEITYPIYENDSIHFLSINAEVNLRASNFLVEPPRICHLSDHAIMRLVQRLELNNDNRYMDELNSGLVHLPAWNKAALQIGARTWPILTREGIFIASPSKRNEDAVLVTWITRKNLSPKWEQAFRNLNEAKTNGSRSIFDPEWIRGFIRSHHTLMSEHLQGPDLSDVHWGIEEVSNSAFPANSNTDISLESPNHTEAEGQSEKPTSNIDIPDRYSIHKAKILRIRNGNVFCVLPGGAVAILLSNIVENSARYDSTFFTPNVGDELEVFIYEVKITNDSTASVVIYAEPNETSLKRWDQIICSYPVGSTVKSKTLKKTNGAWLLKLADGTPAKAPSHVIEHMLATNRNILSGEGQCDYLFSVVDQNSLTRRLTLGFNKDLEERKVKMKDKFVVGDKVDAICLKRYANYALLKLDDYTTGILTAASNFGLELPGEGKKVIVRIKKWDSRFLSFQVITVLNIQPLREMCSVGQFIDVRVLHLVNHMSCYLVRSTSGLYGLIKEKAALTKLEPGSVFTIKVDTIDYKLNHFFGIEKKRSDLIENFFNSFSVGDTITGKIEKKMDYGYFVQLSGYPLSGLLHNSDLSSSSSLKVDSEIQVLVKNIDKEAMRVSLQLASSVEAKF